MPETFNIEIGFSNVWVLHDFTLLFFLKAINVNTAKQMTLNLLYATMYKTNFQ